MSEEKKERELKKKHPYHPDGSRRTRRGWGRPAHAHTLFSKWLIEAGYDNISFAASIGCHPITIARYRAGWPISVFYSRMIRALHPSCPLPKRGPSNVSDEEIPAQEPAIRILFKKLPHIVAAERRNRILGIKKTPETGPDCSENKTI